MMQNADRAYVAFHEAGHATLNFLFDHEVEMLTIVQDGDRMGGVLIDRAGDDALRYEYDEVKQVRFERRIMVSMAGDIAQRRFDAASVYEGGDAGDWRNINEHLEELDTPTDEIRAAYTRVLQLRAEALVVKHWPRVERIAALLLRQGTATGDEAREAFIDPARRTEII